MDFLFSLIPFILIFGVMWFVMVRPQQKRAKETQEMLNNLGKGDTVITIGGIHGVIDEVDNELGVAVLDCQGVYLTFERRAIARVVTKNDTDAKDLGTNVPENNDTEES